MYFVAGAISVTIFTVGNVFITALATTLACPRALKDKIGVRFGSIALLSSQSSEKYKCKSLFVKVSLSFSAVCCDSYVTRGLQI